MCKGAVGFQVRWSGRKSPHVPFLRDLPVLTSRYEGQDVQFLDPLVGVGPVTDKGERGRSRPRDVLSRSRKGSFGGDPRHWSVDDVVRHPPLVNSATFTYTYDTNRPIVDRRGDPEFEASRPATTQASRLSRQSPPRLSRRSATGYWLCHTSTRVAPSVNW